MIQNLFPTSIYYSQLKKSLPPSFNKELLKECLKFAEIDTAGQKWCLENYLGGYTSYGSLSELHRISSTFSDLEKEFNKHVIKFAKHLEMDMEYKKLYLSSCWINIMPPGVTHSMHIHPLSVISGTYYVQTPSDCSSLKFEDPRLTCFMNSPPRKADASISNQRFHHLRPEAGHIVLFESWTRHEVPPNRAKKERVSISFNYDW